MQSVNIPIDLFGRLVRYHVLDLADPEDGEAIKAALKAKLNAMERRNVYTQSKIAATPEERETARLEYLDLARIPQDFRR